MTQSPLATQTGPSPNWCCLGPRLGKAWIAFGLLPQAPHCRTSLRRKQTRMYQARYYRPFVLIIEEALRKATCPKLRTPVQGSPYATVESNPVGSLEKSS